MLLVFWGVTPFQSAIFVLTLQNVTHVVDVSQYPSLVPVSEQSTTLDEDFMNRAYDILWLNAPVPAFMTHQLALSPFNLSQTTGIKSLTGTLTAFTNAFWTDLECKAAVFAPTPRTTPDTYTFFDDASCSTTVHFACLSGQLPNHHIMMYITNWSNIVVEQVLQVDSCPSASHEFLAIAADTSQGNRSLVAQFCSPKYYSQAIKATVNLPDYQVISTEPSRPATVLNENILNITHFEYLLGHDENGFFQTSDYPNQNTNQQDLKIAQYNISFPWQKMVGFALGNKNISVQEYLDPQKMQQGYEAAHQLLFALAVGQLLGNETSLRSATLTVQTKAISVVRGFAIGVEAALVCVALATLALIIITWDRPNKLRGDPASISDLMKLLPDAEHRDPLFLNSGGLNSVELDAKFHGERFWLDYADASSMVPTILHVDSARTGKRRLLSKKSTHSTHSATRVRPFELRYPVGIFFTSVLLSITVLLVVLYQQTHVRGGLPQPSKNIMVRQIVLNYLPTAFATIVEPTWVLLNRLLCVLQPFETLRSGRAPEPDSIGLKYTSLPPQLVAIRALRAKHFLLASVCMIALLANLLAVALSSLFQEDTVSVAQNSSFSQTIAPLFTGKILPFDEGANGLSQPKPLDHYYLLNSNYTDGAPLPPWTTPTFYFLPFGIEPLIGENVLYQAATCAFGIKSTCRAISSTNGPNEIDLHLSSNDSTFHFSANPAAKDLQFASCVASDLEARFAFFSTTPGLPIPSGPASHENVLQVTQCGNFLVTSWYHAQFSDPLTAPTFDSLDYLVLACGAELLSGEFLTTVDATGYIIDAQAQGAFAGNVSQFFTPKISADSVISTLDKFMTFAADSSMFYWHSGSHATEYFNFILKPLLNGSNTDPLAPAPPASLVAPLVEKIHTSIFAILLALTPTAFETIPDQNNRIPGKVFSDQRRIFMNPVMTIMAISILSLNCIVVIILYARRPGKWLPRMPTNVASILGFVGGAWEPGAGNPRHSERRDAEHQTWWGFGKYLGRDGKVQIGIERWPFVQPLGDDGTEELRGDSHTSKEGSWKPSWWAREAAPPVPDKD